MSSSEPDLISQAASFLESWKNDAESTSRNSQALAPDIADRQANKLWPRASIFPTADCVPQGGKGDIGRRILRKKLQGWAAIGIISGFEPMHEGSVGHPATVESEMCEEMATLHRKRQSDLWKVLFGNGEEGHYDIAWIIAGLNAYHKMVNSVETQKSSGITTVHLDTNAVPPGFSLAPEDPVAVSKRKKVTIAEKPRRSAGRAAKPPKTPSSSGKKRSRSGGGLVAVAADGGTEPVVVTTTTAATGIEVQRDIDIDGVVCVVCKGGDNEENILICDGCNICCHLACTDPPLTAIPQSNWFCQSCIENGVQDAAVVTEVKKDDVVKFRGECEFCGKVFASRTGLKYHTNNVCINAIKGKNGISKLAATRSLLGEDVDAIIGKRRSRDSSKPFSGDDDAEYDSEWEEAKSTSKGGKRSKRSVGAKNVAKKANNFDDSYEDVPRSPDDLEDNTAEGPTDVKRKNKSKKRLNDDDRLMHTHTGVSRGDRVSDAVALDARNATKIMKYYNKRKQSWLSIPMAAFTSTFRAHPLGSAKALFHLSLLRGLWQSATACQSIREWIDHQQQASGGEIKNIHVPDAAILVQDLSKATRPILVAPFEGCCVLPTISDISAAVAVAAAAAAANNSSMLMDVEGVDPVVSSKVVGPEDIELFINAGGQVWGTAFAPTIGGGPGDVNSLTANDVTSQPTAAAGSAGDNVTSEAAESVTDTVTVFEKFLAIATARVGFPKDGDGLKTVSGKIGVGHDAPYLLGTQHKFPNLLQIWHVFKECPKELLSSRRKRSNEVVANAGSAMADETVRFAAAIAETKVALVYCVGLPCRGPVWAIEWHPSPEYWIDTVHSDLYRDMLGVLAVVCGDGSCLVLVLPRSDGSIKTPESMQRQQKDKNPSGKRDALSVKVVPESAVCRWEVRVPGALIISVSWSKHDPHQIVCGLQDGSIALFHLALDPPSSVEALGGGDIAQGEPQCPSQPIQCTPYRRIVDHLVDFATAGRSAVRSISMCPYNPQLLLSGGYDGDIKVWNINSPHKPLLVRRPGKGWILSVQWDLQGCGIYGGGSDDTGLEYDGLWADEGTSGQSGQFARRLYSHLLRYGGIWCVHSCISDGQSAVFSASSDGTVRGGYSSCLVSKRKPKLNDVSCSMAVIELFRVLRVGDTHATYGTMKSLMPTSASRPSSADDDEWAGPVAVVTIRSQLSTSPQSDVLKVGTPAAALHTIDSTEVYSDNRSLFLAFCDEYNAAKGSNKVERELQEYKKESDSDADIVDKSITFQPKHPPSHPHARLFVYGGAAGLVHVRAVDVLKTSLDMDG